MEVWKQMMNNIEVEELIGVLETIRSDKYPDIPYKHTGHFLQWEPFAVESARNAECGTRSPESDSYPLR